MERHLCAAVKNAISWREVSLEFFANSVILLAFYLRVHMFLDMSFFLWIGEFVLLTSSGTKRASGPDFSFCFESLVWI